MPVPASLLVFWNVLMLAGIVFVYVFVARRRARVRLLVDHLAALARSALPLQTGLRIVGRDLGGLAGVRLGRLAHRLEDGRPLGEAFDAVPEAAPPIVRKLASLGDRSGNLAGFLDALRVSYRRLAEIQGQSIFYFVYPLVLTLFISGAVSAMHAFVLPKMAEVFVQLNVANPYGDWTVRLTLMNEALIAVTLLLLVLVAAGGGSFHFGGRMAERFLSAIVRRLPLLGRTLRDGSLAAFSITTALFLKAGATLSEAVRAAAESERRDLLRSAYERVARGVEEGDSLSAALRKERSIPGDLGWFVASGEQSGSLPDTLAQASAHYETRVGWGRQAALRMFVPVMAVLNGAMVFGTALLVMLPLRDMIVGVGGW